VTPLLLLATPGRASPRSTGARPHVAGTVVLTRQLSPGILSSVASRWTVRVALAADHSPPPVTTTTSTSPHMVTAVTAAPRQVSVPPPATTTTTSTTTSTTMPPRLPQAELGEASWYDTRTGYCASPYLSFGTVVTITDLATGIRVSCTVDDRQAINPGRVVDLSYDGFAALGDPSIGLIEVRLTW